MNTINAKWGTTKADLGILGRVGEANCTQIVWDVESILTEWPDATIKCIVQRAGDTEPYQASLAESGNTRICVLSAVELAKEGKTTIELRALKDDMVSKSAFYFGRVLSSLQGEGDTPSEPIADILNQLEERVQDAQTAMEVVDEAVDKADKASAKAVEAVDAAGEAVTEAKLAIASAELATETAKTAAENAQSVADDIKAAKEAGEFDGRDGVDGTNGVDGKDGVDGVSPTVTTSKSGDTTTITITDKDGIKTATIKDGAKGADGAQGAKGDKGDKGDTGAQGIQGEKGADGAPGAAGADGFSPTAKVTKSGDTATITITDKTGTTSAEVVDGSDAEVTKENVVAALGYEPAKIPGEWELINEMTLTEATQSNKITTDTNGKSFVLSHSRCEIVAPSGLSSNAGCTAATFFVYNGASVSIGIYQDVLLTVNRNLGVMSADCDGTIAHFHIDGCDKWNARQPSYHAMRKIDAGSGITAIEIYSGSGVPAGTKITLYGIRA